MGKIMRVSMSELKVNIEETPTEYQGLGGRGLTSQIISREVNPMADPLGIENKLIFSAGILAGTTVPNSGRLSVGAKSPLTNTIKEANSGVDTHSIFPPAFTKNGIFSRLHSQIQLDLRD